MAQYWLDLATDPRTDAEILADFTFSQVAGTSVLDIVDDSGARAIRLRRTVGTALSCATVSALGSAVGSAVIVARLRTDLVSTTAPAGIGARLTAGAALYGYGAVSSSSSAAQNQEWDNNTTNGASLGSAETGLTLSSYHYAMLETTGSTIRQKRWAGARGDEPGAWLLSSTDATTVSGGVGFVQRGGTNIGIVICTQLAIGTNGDPAPTGPVGGRQRSRLILTPW